MTGHDLSLELVMNNQNIDRSDEDNPTEAKRTGPSRSFLHVHVCTHCGSPFRREEVEGRVHTTGLFLCPKCEIEGPLNIEILSTENDASSPLKSE